MYCIKMRFVNTVEFDKALNACQMAFGVLAIKNALQFGFSVLNRTTLALYAILQKQRAAVLTRDAGTCKKRT